ncbi:hypothetical protein IFO70_29555 [Phormidium tenue FACHB-886]|nr:hypothetical protein [Phormidium tenue FACHB-886]
MATEVPEKLNFLVQELSAVQEEVDGLETYLDEMGDRATDLFSQVETALEELQTEPSERTTSLTEGEFDS